MTISSSLNAGVASLKANANRLATISDNIANSSTFGYKRVETDFHSMVTSGQGGSYSAGGVRTTSQRLIDQRGSLVTTNNSTDLAVRGRGMLPVRPSSQIAGGSNEMQLTTTGSFRTNEEGYLVTESGLVLLGWRANRTNDSGSATGHSGGVGTYPAERQSAVRLSDHGNEPAYEPAGNGNRCRRTRRHAAPVG